MSAASKKGKSCIHIKRNLQDCSVPVKTRISRMEFSVNTWDEGA